MAANNVADNIGKEQVSPSDTNIRIKMLSLKLPWPCKFHLWVSKKRIMPKLTKVCFDKCIEKRYKESELNMGENNCIDRCVAKYWQVTNLVGQLLGPSQPSM